MAEIEKDTKNNQPQKDTDSKTLKEAIPSKIKISQITITSSPLPPPEVLEKYKEIDPSLPDRLVKMIEREQRHRHLITFLGEIFGFIVVLGGFISAIVLGIYGKEWLAGTIGLGAIASIVGAYFYGKREAIKEQNQKKEND